LHGDVTLDDTSGIHAESVTKEGRPAAVVMSLNAFLERVGASGSCEMVGGHAGSSSSGSPAFGGSELGSVHVDTTSFV